MVAQFSTGILAHFSISIYTLQPVSVSASGEFAAILPSEEVVSWFEDNAGETDIPAEVAALKKVGEEDNPVVVIME